jgi:hypothetical protein
VYISSTLDVLAGILIHKVFRIQDGLEQERVVETNRFQIEGSWILTWLAVFCYSGVFLLGKLTVAEIRRLVQTALICAFIRRDCRYASFWAPRITGEP